MWALVNQDTWQVALKLYFAEVTLLKVSIYDIFIPMHAVWFYEAYIRRCDYMMYNCHFLLVKISLPIHMMEFMCILCLFPEVWLLI